MSSVLVRPPQAACLNCLLAKHTFRAAEASSSRRSGWPSQGHSLMLLRPSTYQAHAPDGLTSTGTGRHPDLQISHCECAVDADEHKDALPRLDCCLEPPLLGLCVPTCGTCDSLSLLPCRKPVCCPSRRPTSPCGSLLPRRAAAAASAAATVPALLRLSCGRARCCSRRCSANMSRLSLPSDLGSGEPGEEPSRRLPAAA